MSLDTDIEAILQCYGFRPAQERTWQEASHRWALLTSHQRDYDKQQIRLRWLSDRLCNCLLSEIDADRVISLATEKRSLTSASTANRHLALLRAILRAARDDWHWLHTIPKIHFFPEPEHRVRWLTPCEAARLIRELPEHLAEMAVFTLATGLRQSNVTGLQWSSVDLHRRTAWVMATDSKSFRSFSIPLNKTALRILRKRKFSHKTHVFDYKGNVISRCSNSAWSKAKARAKIQDFRWHDLRHTWASWHVQSGTTLYELQELGGWKTLDMVLRYAHLSGDQLAGAANRIEENLSHLE